jgi:thiosulfate dehydrogenase
MLSNERQRVEGGEEPSRPALGRGVRTAILAVGGGAAIFAIATIAFDSGFLRDRGEPREDGAAVQPQMFQPPSENTIPDGPAGDAIRRGKAIFVNTASNAGDFVGNGLACASCHLDSGRRADSAPMWAAWVAYPKYRSKNKQINTMEDRIKGCFTYSMNAQASKSGGPPPAGHDVYKDLETYMHWLATGAPTGTSMPGAGYPELTKTTLGYDRERGRKVFEARCAVCHSVDGAGQTDINGRTVFPPLWGPNSYNWGAGMARVNTAAGFIKANMPLGQGNSLTDQQAWDVAAYIDSHERPKDPRQSGSIEENAKTNHGGDSYYGKRIGRRLVGVGTP